MFKNTLKDRHLSIIPTTLFLGVFLSVLIRFFAGDYYAIYTANLFNSFGSEITINLPSGHWYNQASFHTPSPLIVDVTSLPGRILGARVFMDSKEERNVRDDKMRPYEVVEENGKKFVRLLFTMVPFNEIPDGRHEVKVMILYGDSKNPQLAIAKKRILADYNNPTAEFLRNNESSNLQLKVIDPGSGIANISVLRVDNAHLDFVEVQDAITLESDSRSEKTYNIHISDEKVDHIVVVSDGAGNSEFLSLTEKKTADQIFEAITKSQAQQKRFMVPPGNPENTKSCAIYVKHYYYDESGSAPPKGGFWGNDPQGVPYKEGVLKEAHISGLDSVVSTLTNAINQHNFPSPSFIDFSGSDPRFVVEKFSVDPASTLTVVPNTTLGGNMVILDYNNSYIFAQYIRQKTESHIIPIVFIDNENSPGLLAATDLATGVIVVPYLSFVTSSGNLHFFEMIKLKAVLAHELGHTHGLGHNQSDPMNIMATQIFGAISLLLDQAAAFMAHTRNCFDKGFEPEQAGTFQLPNGKPDPDGYCGEEMFTQSRLLDFSNGGYMEQCESTFSSPFRPTPGATQVKLGAGSHQTGEPFSYCPIISDPGHGGKVFREVHGITSQNLAGRIAEFGIEKIRYCVPPGHSTLAAKQCTCISYSEATQHGPVPDPVGGSPTSKGPITPAPSGNPVPKLPPPPNKPITPGCGDGLQQPGEMCGEPGLPQCDPGYSCNSYCECEKDCGNGKVNTGEECNEPGLQCQANYKCETQSCSCYKACGDGVLDNPPEECDNDPFHCYQTKGNPPPNHSYLCSPQCKCLEGGPQAE